MSTKTLPFTLEQLEAIVAVHPTPFHLYDEAGIRENARRFNAAFAWHEGFREFFALKATPNPHIVTILREEGFGIDCSSLAELVLAQRLGMRGEDLFFSSNDTPAGEYRMARELGAVINLDDISHIPFLEREAGLPDLISFRFNPGPERTGNAIIGNPVEAKYGLTRAQMFEAYRICSAKGISRFGLHAMIISNELNPLSFVETAELMFDLAIEIHRETGVRFEFINLGGGMGIPYCPGEEPVDFHSVSAGIRRAWEARIVPAGLAPLRLYTECGRMITGPFGSLVARVLHIKETYKRYVGLDACMAHLMRPALYGAYHYISVPAKAGAPADTCCDVTGSLCENNDKFAVNRMLPRLEAGDLVVLHDTGAHGHAMGFNYNGKLRSAELLLRPDGQVVEIRRAETLDDYFATLDFTTLPRITGNDCGGEPARGSRAAGEGVLCGGEGRVRRQF